MYMSISQNDKLVNLNLLKTMNCSNESLLIKNWWYFIDFKWMQKTSSAFGSGGENTKYVPN
jgi:hypothetical protein